jgi:hypothetical protein
LVVVFDTPQALRLTNNINTPARFMRPRAGWPM